MFRGNSTRSFSASPSRFLCGNFPLVGRKSIPRYTLTRDVAVAAGPLTMKGLFRVSTPPVSLVHSAPQDPGNSVAGRTTTPPCLLSQRLRPYSTGLFRATKNLEPRSSACSRVIIFLVYAQTRRTDRSGGSTFRSLILPHPSRFPFDLLISFLPCPHMPASPAR